MKKLLFVLFVLAFIFIRKPSKIWAAPTGNYVDFNGGYIKASGIAGNYSTISFDAWINPTDVSGIKNIFSIGDKSGTWHYNFGVNGGSLSLQYRFGTGSSRHVSAGLISPNTWTHVTAKIAPTDTSLFINDSKIISTTGATNLSTLGASIIVGGSYDENIFSPNKFLGSMDEVSLSANDKLLYWKLDGLRGQTVVMDFSPYGKNGVFVGNDSQIHFHGALPTPTPFSGYVFPTLGLVRPTWVFPTSAPLPTMDMSGALVRPTRPSR